MKLQEVKERLLEIDSLISGLGEQEVMYGPKELVGSLFEEIGRLAQQEVKEGEMGSFLRDPSLREPLRRISRLRTCYNLRLEREACEEILASADPWETLRGFRFYRNYLTLVETEGKAAGLERGERVVMLGCGPLPITLIVMARTFGVKGLGIERDRGWASLAQRVLEKLGLSREIEVAAGDHKLLPSLGNYKLVVIAALAEPKQEIFDLLASSIPRGAFISCRLYEEGLRAILYETAPFRVPSALEEVVRIPPSPPVNNSVVIFRRSGD